MRNRRKNEHARTGAAVVELALCLPLLVVFTLGTIEICNCIYKRQSLAITAYEGARVALIVGATEENVRTQCDFLLADRRLHEAVVTIAPDDFESAPAGTFIAVEVSVPHAPNSILPTSVFAQEFMTARVEMMKEY